MQGTELEKKYMQGNEDIEQLKDLFILQSSHAIACMSIRSNIVLPHILFPHTQARYLLGNFSSSNPFYLEGIGLMLSSCIQMQNPSCCFAGRAPQCTRKSRILQQSTVGRPKKSKIWLCP